MTFGLIFRGRVSQVSTRIQNLQLCKVTKEEFSSGRITTLNPSDKSTYDLRISGKKTQPHVKSVGPLLFVCLFVLQSCKGLEGVVLESAKGLY